MPIKGLLPPLAVALLLLLFTGCKQEEPSSTEEQIRNMIASAEAAAEERDLDKLLEHVSDQYRDMRGQGKETAAMLLRYYFSSNQAVNLLTRTAPPSFPRPDSAEVTVFVAMTGQAISSAEQLSGIRGDLFRFDFTLFEEQTGVWRVVSARWRRAAAADFF